jgi:IS30 family transposase
MGRPFKLTDHQKREAIKRRNQGETLADIGRRYNVSPSTISRSTA